MGDVSRKRDLLPFDQGRTSRNGDRLSRPALTSLAVLVALVASTTCARAGAAIAPPPVAAPQTGDVLRVTLAIDHPHVLDNGTELVFREVADDSRCPTDADCVWAGDASVVLGVRPAAGEPTLVTLHTGQPDTRAASAAGLRLTLERLDPQPSSGQPIERLRYRAIVALGK